jgi:acyl-coenzyme A synthetase/AMP-(fatty) acid ligase
MDEDGYITYLGRHNDLMNAGGFRVSPAEVEQELAKHPAVAEVAVTEAAIREGVSIIAAFVVAHGDEEGRLASELPTLARGVLVAYKCPREYIFVQSLPKTPNGKIKRGDLKSLMLTAR